MMQILLDTNVLLDFLLNRQPGKAAASAIVQANNKGIITGYLAAFSFPTIYYFSYKHYNIKYDSNQARVRAWEDIKTSLEQFKICSVSRQTLESATKMPGPDFEDNLQIACALAEGLDAIVTSNIKDFRDAGITLYTPAQLVKKLKLRLLDARGKLERETGDGTGTTKGAQPEWQRTGCQASDCDA